jgi:carbonic anhydrase
MKELHKLIEGNKRFVANIPLAHNLVARQNTIQGEKPIAAIITCCDSRVSPEYIFDQEVGKLLTIRNIGNIVNENVLASVEYAIEYLGIKLIIVMGHQDCGAITACACYSKGNEYLDDIMDVIYPVMEDAHRLEGNPLNSMAELHAINMSNIVKRYVEDKAEVLSAFYNLE